MSTCADTRSDRVRAFTIVEILVSIAVIAVLLAIAIPSFSRVKQKSTEQLCVYRIRSASLAITQYTLDNKDTLPFGGYERDDIEAPYGERVAIGGQSGLRAGRWTLLFEEYWDGDQWDEGMRCPKQPQYDPDSPDWWDPEYVALTDGAFREPWYWMSSAFHLTTKSLSHVTADPAVFEVMPQKMYSVRYPSSKSLIFEFFGFCIPISEQSQYWLELGQTQLFPTSSAAADGSAFRFAQRNAYQPAFGLGCDYTLNGVRGRDIDRTLESHDAFARLNSNSWGE